jgi:hypothetical protein
MTDKTSPSLEVVSDPDRTLSPIEGERRRLPRLSLSAEQFRLSQTGKIYSVVDLSNHGMGLRILDRADFLLFPVATVIEGTLNLAGDKHPLKARVRRLGAETIGCEFEGNTPELQGIVDAFLSPQRLGAELKPIPSSESGTLWYHGNSGTDLLFRRGTDGQYHRMTLYMLGSFVQWSAEDGLSTGRVRPSDQVSEPRGVMRLETLWLDADPQADLGKLAVAKTLVLSSNLPEDFKKWCTRKLEVS